MVGKFFLAEVFFSEQLRQFAAESERIRADSGGVRADSRGNAHFRGGRSSADPIANRLRNYILKKLFSFSPLCLTLLLYSTPLLYSPLLYSTPLLYYSTSLLSGNPVLVLQGSGRSADIIAKAYSYSTCAIVYEGNRETKQRTLPDEYWVCTPSH